MQNYFAIVILLLFPLQSYGLDASSPIDSLKTVLQHTGQDTNRVAVLTELAYELLYEDAEAAKTYADQAYRLADQLGFQKGKAASLMRLGAIEMLDGNYVAADSLYRGALTIRKVLGVKAKIASTYNNLGLLQYYQDEDSIAVEIYREGLAVVANQPSSREEAMLLTNLSTSLMYLGNYQEAIASLQKSIEIIKVLGDRSGEANALLTLGNLYREIDNPDKALQLLEKSYELFTQLKDENGQAKCLINLGNVKYSNRRYEGAIGFFEQALQLKEWLEEEDLMSIYMSTGNIYEGTNRHAAALTAHLAGLDIATTLSSAKDQASFHYNIGMLHKDQSDFQSALVHLKNSYELLDTLQAPMLEILVTNALSDTYAQLNEVDLALELSQQHNALQDSLDENYRQAMNYKLEYDEEQKKVALLKKEQALQISENKRKSLIIIWLIIGGILWILLSIASFFAYRNRQEKQKAEQQTRAAYQEIDDLLKNQQLKTTYARLEGQEEARKLIAQDLHDRVGSILSTVMLYFKGFDSRLDSIQQENQKQYSKVNQLLDEAVVEVRRISQNIHSGTLTKFGLNAELEALSEILKDSNSIQVKVLTHGLEERLPAALEIKVYRIIQELISNVLKHAQASKITVQVNQFKDVLNILVEDDGKGFDVASAKLKEGMGLKNVESRVYDLHGSIIIDSGKGSGTTVTIDIPVEA